MLWPSARCSGRWWHVLANAPALSFVDNADHSFHVPVRSGRTDAQVRQALLACVAALDGRAAVSKRALERYAAKRTFTRTPEPPAKIGGEAARAVAVRRAEACGAAAALRLAARARRGAQVLGRAQRALARSRRQAHGGGGGRSPVRLRLVRGRDSRQAIWCGQRDRLGLRGVFARRRAAVLPSATAAPRSSACAASWPPAS